ncbi:hypothetical protein CDEST_06494 [Colletotrichum destructivum]|uniref:Uncharacterized protein n=1 Tax=Colletotrichum destructivum TaxID=34406 RepID=A0AAX4IEF8_9PEZI|nr:hypothetical protein CDEST_06494 [Colletotrichum destructivum]
MLPTNNSIFLSYNPPPLPCWHRYPRSSWLCHFPGYPGCESCWAIILTNVWRFSSRCGPGSPGPRSQVRTLSAKLQSQWRQYDPSGRPPTLNLHSYPGPCVCPSVLTDKRRDEEFTAAPWPAPIGATTTKRNKQAMSERDPRPSLQFFLHRH